MQKFNVGGTAGALGQSSSLSPWAGPYVTDMLGKGAALANMPYTAYQGPLTAGASDLQQQAFQGLAGLAVPTATTVGSFTGSMPSYSGGYNLGGPSGPVGGGGYNLGGPSGPVGGGVGYDSRNYVPENIQKQFEAMESGADSLRMRGVDQDPEFDSLAQTWLSNNPDKDIFDFTRSTEFQAYKGAQGMPSAMGAQSPRMSQTPQAQQSVAPQSVARQSVAQQYMNPYVDMALQPQMEEARRQAQIEQQNLQSRYGRAGAYGGGRQAVAEAELSGALQRNLANIYGTGMEKAYDKAADLFGQERNYGLQALQQQLGAGGTQRGIESEGIAADIRQFEQERDYPYKQVQYMQSLLQGLPIETQSYQYAEPTGLANFGGGASAVIGLLQGLGFLDTGKK